VSYEVNKSNDVGQYRNDDRCQRQHGQTMEQSSEMLRRTEGLTTTLHNFGALFFNVDLG